VATSYTDRLLQNNRAWAERKLAERPDFFERSAREQRPAVLWIGCSDSRVPAEDITGAEPGDLFVHRNVANLVVHTDFNVLSVAQYAVEVLELDHVIVCGHTDCGGIRTALSRQSLGLINKWLRHVKDVYRLHAEELDALSDPEERYRRLVELNVIEQVGHLAELSFVQHAWKQERRPQLHGWVYDIHTGLLRALVETGAERPPHEIYTYDFPDS